MMRINLIAIRVPKERIVVQRQVLALIAVIIAAVVVIVWGAGKASAMKTDYEQQLESEKAKLARLETVAKRIEDFEKKKQRREQILEAIKKLEARKVGPRPFLDQLNVILPPDIWLTEVSEQNMRITVSGYSFSNSAIADLMRSMENSTQFSDVGLTGIQNEVVQKENVKSFTLTCNWKAALKIEEKADDKNKPKESPKK